MSNVYHANFRSTDPRPSRQGTSIKFGAADDGTAAAVAAAFGACLSAQMTSLTKQIGGLFQPVGGVLPSGTRLTGQVVVSDSSFNVWRQSVRNMKQGLAGEAEGALAAAFAGSGFVGSVATVTALTAPPLLPDSSLSVAVVNRASIITKY